MDQEDYELPISLFVVHWNQPLECIATATALREQKIGLKTTVIDNDSKPDAFQVLKSQIDPAIAQIAFARANYAGRTSALLRAVMILLNTWRLSLRSPGGNFALSARARFRAVRDYFAGRWGRPDFAE